MKKKKRHFSLDKLSGKLIHGIGTNTSILIHTVLFIGIFSLKMWGVTTDDILLILTTAVSLEAIYLAIFIQMSVNKTTVSLASVEEDIDDIQEDVDDIQEDVDSLETNIKEISEDYLEDDTEDTDMVKVLQDMELRLKEMQRDIATLQKHKVS